MREEHKKLLTAGLRKQLAGLGPKAREQIAEDQALAYGMIVALEGAHDRAKYLGDEASLRRLAVAMKMGEEAVAQVHKACQMVVKMYQTLGDEGAASRLTTAFAYVNAFCNVGSAEATEAAAETIQLTVETVFEGRDKALLQEVLNAAKRIVQEEAKV